MLDFSWPFIQKASKLRTVKCFFANKSFVNEIKSVDQDKAQEYGPDYEL